MVNYYTSLATLTLDIDLSTVIQIIIIVSTTCYSILPNHIDPFVDFIGETSVNTGNGEVILVIRFSISYDYRHDLNVFSREVIEYIINELGLPRQKIAVIVEGD
jgi:hypothetical protein